MLLFINEPNLKKLLEKSVCVQNKIVVFVLFLYDLKCKLSKAWISSPLKLPFGILPAVKAHCFAIHGAEWPIGIISNLITDWWAGALAPGCCYAEYQSVGFQLFMGTRGSVHKYSWYMPPGASSTTNTIITWWRPMTTSSNGKIFSITGCLWGEPLVTGEFPSQRPVTQSFDIFFDLSLNKQLSKESRRQWFETPSLWRHCNEHYVQPRSGLRRLATLWFLCNWQVCLLCVSIICLAWRDGGFESV